MTASLKQRWVKGDVTLGAWCMIPEPLTAEALGRAGFDWVLVDMQHGCISTSTQSNPARPSASAVSGSGIMHHAPSVTSPFTHRCLSDAVMMILPQNLQPL